MIKYYIPRGSVIVILGLLYGMTTTAFFGNHFFPQSADECITDGLALVVVAIGIARGGGDK